MTNEGNDIVPVTEKEKAEIQQILQEVPDDILIGIIADRIQREPNKEIKEVVQAVSQHRFSGPIPPPSMLGEYDAIHDGLANRIVGMAESQQAHRQSLEKRSVEAAIKTESRGQHYALIVSFLIIAGAMYLIGSGKEISGTLLAGGTLTGLAYIFITGRKKEKPVPSTSEDSS